MVMKTSSVDYYKGNLRHDFHFAPNYLVLKIHVPQNRPQFNQLLKLWSFRYFLLLFKCKSKLLRNLVVKN